jgi:hypothetical protein
MGVNMARKLIKIVERHERVGTSLAYLYNIKEYMSYN